MRAALYIRVSTKDQHAENQLEVLRKWAKNLGAVGIIEYVDHASGATSDRAELTRMLQDGHRRKFDVLLIWALDRLSRGGISTMTGYLEKLKAFNVRVLSHQEPWLDTKGPVADLLIAIFAWMGQQERQRISERVKAGLERAKKNGKILGRPPANVDPFWFVTLQQKGLTIRQISKKTNISKSVISRVLNNGG